MTKEEISEIKKQLCVFGDAFSDLCKGVRELEELQESCEKNTGCAIEYVSVNLPYEAPTVSAGYKGKTERFVIRGTIGGEQSTMFFVEESADVLKEMIKKQYEMALAEIQKNVELSYSKVKYQMQILLKNNLFDE